MPNIDFDKVRQAWLTWHNELRIQQGLDPYTYHSDLEKTAKNWADYLVALKVLKKNLIWILIFIFLLIKELQVMVTIIIGELRNGLQI